MLTQPAMLDRHGRGLARVHAGWVGTSFARCMSCRSWLLLLLWCMHLNVAMGAAALTRYLLNQPAAINLFLPIPRSSSTRGGSPRPYKSPRATPQTPTHNPSLLAHPSLHRAVTVSAKLLLRASYKWFGEPWWLRASFTRYVRGVRAWGGRERDQLLASGGSTSIDGDGQGAVQDGEAGDPEPCQGPLPPPGVPPPAPPRRHPPPRRAPAARLHAVPRLPPERGPRQRAAPGGGVRGVPRGGLRLRRLASPARVPGGPGRVQAGPRARVHARACHPPVRARRRVRRREHGVPEADDGAVGARRGHALPGVAHEHPRRHVPAHGQGGVRGRRLRRPRRTYGQDRRARRGHRSRHRQLQPLQPDAVLRLAHRQPIPPPRGRRQPQPQRHGVQRRHHRHRPRQAPTSGAPRHVRAGGEHGEHHPERVPGQQPPHAGHQHALPRRRRRRAALQPARRPGARQVPAHPHGAHPPRRQRPELRLRHAGGGRLGGPRRRLPLQGAHVRRRRGAAHQHHHAGPARAAALRAAPLPRHRRPQARLPRRRQAAHPGLHPGPGALLHPRRREGRAGRAGAQPQAQRLAHGAVQDDALQVRQHLQQLALVRALLLRGQGEDQEGGQGVADRLRLRVQVQQRRLEGAQGGRRRGQRRALGQGHQPAARARAQGGAHRRTPSILQTKLAGQPAPDESIQSSSD